MTVREAVDRLAGVHHYANEASARGSLLDVVERGLIEGVEV